MRRTVPSTIAFTGCKFGSNRRGPTLWAWETVRPTFGPLSQISQRLAMIPLDSWAASRRPLRTAGKLQIVAASGDDDRLATWFGGRAPLVPSRGVVDLQEPPHQREVGDRVVGLHQASGAAFDGAE